MEKNHKILELQTINKNIMRCRNCGWENPDGYVKCEKCHVNINDIPINSADKQTTPVSDRMKSTVAESVIFNDFPPTIPKSCPKCGYPVGDNSDTCPNCNHEIQVAITTKQVIKCKSCGFEISAESKFCPECGNPVKKVEGKACRIQRVATGTIMGGPIVGGVLNNKFCTLKPIAWKGENVSYNPVTYSGDTIILNRANTDANNNSITSHEQAVLTSEDGEWYIENKSDLKTTFIRVNGRVKLTDGDIIVLGNREFEFKG